LLLPTGELKGETGEHQLFAFLATESNDVVRPIHAKAMPVLLTSSRLDKEWLCSKSELGRSRKRLLSLNVQAVNQQRRMQLTPKVKSLFHANSHGGPVA
jgi:putative SOS response-associated peptidase YedK